MAPSRLDRAQIGLLGALLALALLAWFATDNRMGEMDSTPGMALGSLGFYLTVWVVMMAAMMFPSISPMVAIYSRLQRSRREAGKLAPAGATAIFVGGYLVTWTLAGLLAYALFDAVRSADFDVLSWDRGGRYLAAGVLLGAALYQLTPLKYACLRRCRGPLGFIIENWRDGRLGALRMGMLHGAWCVGCCWALMAALFALGVMSIGWMIFIAGLIAVEKLAPWQWLATNGVAAVLVALGIWVAVAPADVPGLTVPGSPEAAMSMSPQEDTGMGGTQEDSGMGEESMGGGSQQMDSAGSN